MASKMKKISEMTVEELKKEFEKTEALGMEYVRLLRKSGIKVTRAIMFFLDNVCIIQHDMGSDYFSCDELPQKIAALKEELSKK